MDDRTVEGMIDDMMKRDCTVTVSYSHSGEHKGYYVMVHSAHRPTFRTNNRSLRDAVAAAHTLIMQHTQAQPRQTVHAAERRDPVEFMLDEMVGSVAEAPNV